MTKRAAALTLIIFASSAGSALAQPHPSSSAGEDLYRTYCASCHGPTGLGNGPVAPALRRPPANLTTFSIANGDVFPAEKLRRIIDGRDIASHGTPDMPVWGAVFKVPGRGITETDIRARIGALVDYIKAIQVSRGQ